MRRKHQRGFCKSDSYAYIIKQPLLDVGEKLLRRFFELVYFSTSRETATRSICFRSSLVQCFLRVDVVEKIAEEDF